MLRFSVGNRMPASQAKQAKHKQQVEDAPDALWLEDIEEQLIELARASAQRWQKIAVLMIEVEEQSLWEGVAESYTAWVRNLATKAEVHESNLWRALKAGKFYNQVRDEAQLAQETHLAQQEALANAETELQTGQCDPIVILPEMPALGDLESKTSPESFELIEKISRAAPPEKTAELVQRTLAGETTRRELRIAWQDYRPAVRGTARGRAPQGQTKQPPRAAEPLRVTAGDIVQALRANRGQFIDGRLSCQQWSVHTEVPVRPGTTRHARLIDAVCAEMATPEQAHPGFHAVEIKVQRSDLVSDQKLTEYADFVDTLWLAVPDEFSDEALGLVPDWVGVLAFHEQLERHEAPAADPHPPRPLRVVCQAGEIPRKADMRGELAFELLKRLL